MHLTSDDRPQGAVAQLERSTSVAPEAEDIHLHDSPRSIDSWSLWGLGVAVAAVRWWFSHDRVMFHMAPDEPAQLAMARWLSGGVRWNLFDHSTWRPGMAVLMAPLFWLSDDTATIFHGGLLIAAALGGVGAVLLARLGLRLTTLSPTACVLAAGAIAIAPSSLSATAFVWAEGLVTVTFLATLTLLLRFHDDLRLATGCATVTLAALGFTAHSRLLALVPVVTLLLVARCVVSGLWRRGVVIAGCAAATTWASFAFSDLVYGAVWDDPAGSNTVATVLRRLPRVEDNLRSAVGQVWYQLVATAGLAAIGAGVLSARSFRRKQHHQEPAPAAGTVARDARLVLLVTIPLVVLSIVFMSGRTRTDHRIYGRYNDAVLWPVLLVAIAWLVQLRRRRAVRRDAAVLLAVALAVVGAGLAIDQVAGAALADSIGVRPMIAGLLPITGTRSTIEITRVTLLAVALLGALVVAALVTRRPVAMTLLASGLLLAAGVRTHTAMTLRLNSWQPATQVIEIDELIPADATIGFRFVREQDDPPATWDDQRRRAQLYQFALPHRRFVRDRGVDDAVGPYVFAPLGDEALTEVGARVLWTDPRVKIALWEEPTSS